MSRFLVVLVFLLSGLTLSAQNDLVFFSGYVKDADSQLKLAGVKVDLVEEGKVITTFVTVLNGKVELDLAFGHNFEVRFSKEGYVTKFVKIDTRNVPKEEQVGGAGFDTDISLFQVIEGVNFDLFKQPVAIARYSAATKSIEFDFEYTRVFLEKVDELMKNYRKKVQEEEDRLKKEQLAAEQAKQKQEKFEQLVKDGDGLMASGNFSNAIFKFTDALDIKPGTKFVEDKLAAAKKALDEANLMKQKEAQYKEAIAAADKAFSGKNYKQAIADYNKALNHKPTESYPKERIKEAENILAEQAKTDALNKQYAQNIAKGDSVFKANKFEQAIPFYEAALGLKPVEAYPKQKIAEAKTRLDELAKQKALEDKYKGALANGDLAMKEARFADALTAYQEAKALKPSETVPPVKIGEAQAKIDEQAKQKQLGEQYAAEIVTADGLFNAQKYTEAIESYKKASALKPAEAYPKTKITDAQAKLAAIAKQEADSRQYADLIAKADNQFTAKEFSQAQTAYQQALTLKPTEQYPKDQLAKVKTELDKISQQKALDAQYTAIMTRANQAYAAKQYDAAIKSYQQAQGLKPEETLPKQKITEIEDLLGEIAKQKDIDKRYAGVLAKADSTFRSAKYTESIALYNQALEIKEAEMYPKTKIVEANAKLAELAKKDALDKQYKDLLAKGDSNFTALAYNEAIVSFKEASALKPMEVYPKNKIAEAQKRLQDIDKKNADEARFKQLVADGDQLLNNKDYVNASAKYQAALVIKPNEQYPKDQLGLAKTRLDEINKQKALDDQYSGLLAKGDLAFKGQKWQESIGVYQQALALKQNEKYPQAKIDTANMKLADIAKKKQDLDDAYTKAIGLGDEAVRSSDFSSAKVAFQEALKLKPTEAYPKQKIAEMDVKLAELAKKDALDKQYSGLIEKADLAFKNEDYAPAVTAYQQASVLKPAEQYPKTKLAEAQGLLDEEKKQKTLDTQYQALITKANTDMTANSFELALKGFQQASALKPGEQYPKDQIEIAQLRLNELSAAREREQNYKAALTKGDAAFTAKDFNAAIKGYEEALDVKPNEVYPADKIKQANAELQKIAASKELQTRYLAAVAAADSIFKAENWAESITGYKAAQQIKPTETYPAQQIKLAEGKLAEIENARLAKEAKYNGFIQKGDSAFKKESYQVAKNYYSEAFRVKPGEKYPKDKMDEAEAKLDELARLQAEKDAHQSVTDLNKPVVEQKVDPTIVSFKDAAVVSAIKKDTAKAVDPKPAATGNGPRVMYRTAPGNGDLEEFRKKLGENYPEGRTEETFVEGNKKILRTIYVSNKMGDEYLKVVFSTGFGTFYFKNGDGIGSNDFNSEIQRLK